MVFDLCSCRGFWEEHSCCSWCPGLNGGTRLGHHKQCACFYLRFFSFAFMFDRFVVLLFGNGEERLTQK